MPKDGKKSKPKGDPMIVSEAVDDVKLEKKNSDGAAGADDDDNGECENLLKPQNKIGINDFELVKVIGRGSFGKVYMVKRNGT